MPNGSADSMEQYSDEQFRLWLDELTETARRDDAFSAPANVAHGIFYSSINGGEAVRLYRYCALTERNLGDVLAGRVHLCSPDRFNDDVDTMVRFDYQEIRERFMERNTPEAVQSFVDVSKLLLSGPELETAEAIARYSLEHFDELKRDFIDGIEEQVRDWYDKFRRCLACACFSSTAVSAPMWANYAGNNSGFVTAYDVAPYDITGFCAGCGSGSLECGDPMRFFVCPVLYDGLYDMTDFGHVWLGSSAFIPYQTLQSFIAMVHSTIHKTPDWSYEREWRLFSFGCAEALERGDKLYAKLEPVAIIAGTRTTEEGLKQLSDVAEKLGIPLARVEPCVDEAGSSLRIIDGGAY